MREHVLDARSVLAPQRFDPVQALLHRGEPGRVGFQPVEAPLEIGREIAHLGERAGEPIRNRRELGVERGE